MVEEVDCIIDIIGFSRRQAKKQDLQEVFQSIDTALVLRNAKLSLTSGHVKQCPDRTVLCLNDLVPLDSANAVPTRTGATQTEDELLLAPLTALTGMIAWSVQDQIQNHRAPQDQRVEAAATAGTTTRRIASFVISK